MEHIGAGLAQIMGEMLRRGPADEAVRLAWPLVCGGTVAGRTRPLDFASGMLRVEVPDPVWRKQLVELERRYVSDFAQVLGKNTVERIEFVVKER